MTAWIKWLGAFIAPAISAVLNSIFGALRTKRLDQEDDAVHERAARAEAASETQEAIKDVADARANLPDPPDDPDDLSRELRRQGGSDHSGRKRPF